MIILLILSLFALVDGTCIVVICNNRVEILERTLNSIMDARGVRERAQIIISQNGDDARVSKLIRTKFYLLDHIQNDEGLPQKVDSRLPQHFQWTFDTVFDDFYECYNGMVVLEDDLEVSPDFLEYFELTIPVVENDPKLLTTSLWNDIGLEWNSNVKNELLRTTYFPGLGWWLSRSTWYGLLRDEWPTHDWDWYVRKKAYVNGLDTLHPEVPRDYHVAKGGTYMRQNFFEKHFAKININRDRDFRWHEDDVQHVSSFGRYHEHMMTRIENGNQINTIDHAIPGTDNVMWVEGLKGKKRLNTRRCNKFFKTTGIWADEIERSDWYGIKVVWYKPTRSHLIIVDCDSEWWWRRWPVARVFHDLEICDDFN